MPILSGMRVHRMARKLSSGRRDLTDHGNKKYVRRTLRIFYRRRLVVCVLRHISTIMGTVPIGPCQAMG